MPPDPSQRDRTAARVVGLLRRGCWAAVPTGTIESVIEGGRVVDFPPGRTVYTEADAERLAVMMHGLLRVYTDDAWKDEDQPKEPEAVKGHDRGGGTSARGGADTRFGRA